MGWTVAYGYRDRPTAYCGFNFDRKVIERYAREGRAGWENSRFQEWKPTSIRVRKISREAWEAANG